jgi:solute carrier family 35 protein F1/2
MSDSPPHYHDQIDQAPIVSNGNKLQKETDKESLNSESKSPRTWKESISNLFTVKFLIILALGQVLALCITATTIFTTKLSQGATPISIPTSQTFLNYATLGVVYTTITIAKVGFRGWLDINRRRAIYYILFALVDVEANYFMVKAYSYTSLLSAMLLDAWTIPCVVLLCVIFLKMRFIRYHYLGVLLAMVGMAFLIWSDMVEGKNFPGSDYVKGDLFCILAATLYAVSNVYQEFLVRQEPMYEVIGQLGLWGTIISGIQLAILERNEIQTITWTGEVIGYIIGFDIAMFTLYSVAPTLLRLSSATFFNLSLLTSDFYGLILGIILFDYTINTLYPIAYVLIIGGLIVYNIFPSPEAKFKRIFKEEPSDPLKDDNIV